MPISLASATESSGTSAVLHYDFSRSSNQPQTYAVDNRLHAGTRIISKRKRNVLTYELLGPKTRTYPMAMWRKAQSTSLITNQPTVASATNTEIHFRKQNMASQMQQYSIRLILYVVLYYVFNYAFNIQLIFNIQRVIQYSTSHSTFNYSFYIQFLIHPFNYLFNNFNHLFNIQL